MIAKEESRWLARWPVIIAAIVFGVQAVVTWVRLDQMQRQLQVVVEVTCDAHQESCVRLLAAAAIAHPSSVVSVKE